MGCTISLPGKAPETEAKKPKQPIKSDSALQGRPRLDPVTSKNSHFSDDSAEDGRNNLNVSFKTNGSSFHSASSFDPRGIDPVLHASKLRDEAERLAAVRALRVIGTPPDPRFDSLTNLAKALFRTPIAALTLVEDDVVHIHSCAGEFPAKAAPRSGCFCNWLLLSKEPTMLIVEDGLTDARFAIVGHPVTPPNARFYAGAPLVGSSGHIYGSLCVLDPEPRQFKAEHYCLLSHLAEMAVAELERDMHRSWNASFLSPIEAAAKAAVAEVPDTPTRAAANKQPIPSAALESVVATGSPLEAITLLDVSRPQWPIIYTNSTWTAATGESAGHEQFSAGEALFWQQFRDRVPDAKDIHTALEAAKNGQAFSLTLLPPRKRMVRRMSRIDSSRSTGGGGTPMKFTRIDSTKTDITTTSTNGGVTSDGDDASVLPKTPVEVWFVPVAQKQQQGIDGALGLPLSNGSGKSISAGKTAIPDGLYMDWNGTEEVGISLEELNLSTLSGSGGGAPPAPQSPVAPQQPAAPMQGALERKTTPFDMNVNGSGSAHLETIESAVSTITIDGTISSAVQTTPHPSTSNGMSSGLASSQQIPTLDNLKSAALAEALSALSGVRLSSARSSMQSERATDAFGGAGSSNNYNNNIFPTMSTSTTGGSNTASLGYVTKAASDILQVVEATMVDEGNALAPMYYVGVAMPPGTPTKKSMSRSNTGNTNRRASLDGQQLGGKTPQSAANGGNIPLEEISFDDLPGSLDDNRSSGNSLDDANNTGGMLGNMGPTLDDDEGDDITGSGNTTSIVAGEDLSEVVLGPMIGTRSGAWCFRGTWRGAKVSVSVLERWVAASETEDVQSDIAACQLAHPHIVPTFAHCVKDQQSSGSGNTSAQAGATTATAATPAPAPFVFRQIWLVQEFCGRGNLLDGLEKGLFKDPTTGSPNMLSILTTAREIASAMQYVHSRGLAHPYFTSSNICLSPGVASSSDPRGWISKVTSTQWDALEPASAIAAATAATARRGEPVSQTPDCRRASDVLAFGVILWEMFSGRRAYLGSEEFYQADIGLHLTVPRDAPSGFGALMKKCLSNAPEERPSFKTLYQNLDSLLHQAKSSMPLGAVAE